MKKVQFSHPKLIGKTMQAVGNPVFPQNHFCFFRLLPSLHMSLLASFRLFADVEEVLDLNKPVLLNVSNIFDTVKSRVRMLDDLATVRNLHDPPLGDLTVKGGKYIVGM